MSAYKEKLQALIKKYQWQILILCILATLLTKVLYPENLDLINDVDKSVELDTIIPKNHSLFPLDLVNRSAVSAVLGPFGVVDLYRYFKDGKKKLIAKNIKIFRAPKNPESFYVLVPETKATLFIKENDRTFAVIKNRTLSTEFSKQTKKRKRNITVGVDQ